MTNSFQLAISVVLPIFFLLALGYGLTRLGMFGDGFLKQLNNICFKVFLSSLVFYNIYTNDLEEAFSLKLIGFALFCLLSSFFLLFWLAPRFTQDNRRKGVLVQGMFRSNFVLFGMTVATSLGDSTAIATTAVLVAVAIPLYNILSVVALERYRHSHIDFKAIVKGIVTNPLVIATAIAFFFLLTGLKLPMVVEKAVGDVAKIATPLAFIVLGGSFRFSKVGHNKIALFWTLLMKLVAIPLVYVSIAIGLGFRGGPLIALLTMLASPTAVSSFTMAEQMGADDELAGQIVVIGTLFSIITIFCWVFAVNQLGLL